MTKAKLLFFPLVVPVEETEVSAQIIISKANQGHGIMIRIPFVIASQGTRITPMVCRDPLIGLNFLLTVCRQDLKGFKLILTIILAVTRSASDHRPHLV